MALVAIAIVIYIGTRLALAAPAVINGPVMSLSPEYLLIYAAFSMSRMSAAYLLSILFTLLNGYFAADHNRAGQVMMPLLDVLQSVPILSFLPVVLLGLSAFLTQSIAEIASVVLMFTSQVWNLTSAWLRRTCEAAVRLISQVAPSLGLCQHAGVHGILGHAGRP